jgi:hypothetical protein
MSYSVEGSAEQIVQNFGIARRSPILACRRLRVRPGATLGCLARLYHGGDQPRDVGKGRIKSEEV